MSEKCKTVQSLRYISFKISPCGSIHFCQRL